MKAQGPSQKTADSTKKLLAIIQRQIPSKKFLAVSVSDGKVSGINTNKNTSKDDQFKENYLAKSVTNAKLVKRARILAKII